MLLDSFFGRFFEYRKDIIQELGRILDFGLKPAPSEKPKDRHYIYAQHPKVLLPFLH